MRILSDIIRNVTEPLRFEKVEPPKEEVEAMARRMYVAFYKGWEPEETPEQIESRWKRISEDRDNLSSASFAYRSWLACAKEVLK